MLVPSLAHEMGRAFHKCSQNSGGLLEEDEEDLLFLGTYSFLCESPEASPLAYI